ncbi:MAG TPA: hypothetical protein VKR06_46150 [Ktedonosporobacter sp.]|nr:hypothetical protein [Ktedonosporobacter sp.]
MKKRWARGEKAFAKINGKSIAAVVLDAADSSRGDYQQCKIRIAEENHLGGGMLTSVYPKPVQSYRLKSRATIIAELGEKEELL